MKYLPACGILARLNKFHMRSVELQGFFFNSFLYYCGYHLSLYTYIINSALINTKIFFNKPSHVSIYYQTAELSVGK